MRPRIVKVGALYSDLPMISVCETERDGVCCGVRDRRESFSWRLRSLKRSLKERPRRGKELGITRLEES